MSKAHYHAIPVFSFINRIKLWLTVWFALSFILDTKREASLSLNGLLQKSTDEDDDEVGPPKNNIAPKKQKFSWKRY